MKTIFVPTDFSEASRNASLYAVELAKAMDCKIILYHAYHIPVHAMEESQSLVTKLPDEFRKDNIARLKEEVLFLSETAGVIIDFEAVEGLAVDEIIAFEQSQKPYLIIMGMQARGSVNEYIFGSVATDVIRKTQTPIIIVPDKYRFSKIHKMVFANDNSLGTPIGSTFGELLGKFSPKVFIVHVVKEKENIKSGNGVFEQRVEQFFANTIHVYDFLQDNDLIHGLNEFIDQHEIDMIAMLPHRHNLFERMFKESQTQKMAFHSKVPLFVLPIKSSEIDPEISEEIQRKIKEETHP